MPHDLTGPPTPPPPSTPAQFPPPYRIPFFLLFFSGYTPPKIQFLFPPLPAHLTPPPPIFHLNPPQPPTPHPQTPNPRAPSPCPPPHSYQEIYRPFTPTVLNLCKGKICLHFLLFLNPGVGQVVETLLHGKPVLIILLMNWHCKQLYRGCLNIKISCYRYRNSRYKCNSLYNGISYSWKDALYIGAGSRTSAAIALTSFAQNILVAEPGGLLSLQLQ